MKLTLVCIALVGLLSIARAEERVLLARFELKDFTAERPAGTTLPPRAVAFYRSARGVEPFAEYVEVETVLGSRVGTRRLSNAAAGQLLDAFESAALPEVDYQKHFEELAKAPPQGRRGIAWLPDGGGARRVLIELHTANRTARFEIWSPEDCFYSHPSDRTARAVYQLVQACACAIGSGVVVMSADMPSQAAEPTRTTVTPPAGAGDRASDARGSP